MNAAYELSRKVDVDLVNECVRIKCNPDTDAATTGAEPPYKKWLFPNTDGTLGCPKWIKEVVSTEEYYDESTNTDNRNNFVVGKNEGFVDKVDAEPTNNNDVRVDQEETSSDTTTITINTDSSDEKLQSTTAMKDTENTTVNRLCPDLAMTDSDTEDSQ